MLFQTLDKHMDLNADLQMVFEKMKEITEENFPSEPIVLDGERVYINAFQFDTKKQEDCVFECHKRYLDVHYLVSGTECIELADSALLVARGEYDEKADFFLLDGEKTREYQLQKGDALLCYPWEAHKVGIAPGVCLPLKKLVAKILISP